MDWSIFIFTLSALLLAAGLHALSVLLAPRARTRPPFDAGGGDDRPRSRERFELPWLGAAPLIMLLILSCTLLFPLLVIAGELPLPQRLLPLSLLLPALAGLACAWREGVLRWA